MMVTARPVRVFLCLSFTGFGGPFVR